MKHSPGYGRAIHHLDPGHLGVRAAQVGLYAVGGLEQYAMAAHVQPPGHGEIGGEAVAGHRAKAIFLASYALLFQQQAKALALEVGGAVLLPEAVKGASFIAPHWDGDAVGLIPLDGEGESCSGLRGFDGQGGRTGARRHVVHEYLFAVAPHTVEVEGHATLVVPLETPDGKRALARFVEGAHLWWSVRQREGLGAIDDQGDTAIVADADLSAVLQGKAACGASAGQQAHQRYETDHWASPRHRGTIVS